MTAIKAYVILNLVNGKKYVGVTAGTVEKRWAQHLYCAAKGRKWPIYSAIRKYGLTKFQIEEVAEAYSKEEAARLERALIAKHGSMVPNGYNQTIGGEFAHGGSYSLESRKKMSVSGKQRYINRPQDREMLAEFRRNRPWSEESKKKASISHTGKKNSPEHRAAIAKALSDPEVRIKISQGVRRAMKEGRAQHTMTEELRSRLSAATTRQINAPGAKEHLSAKTKEQFADPEKRARHQMATKIAMAERRRKLEAGEIPRKVMSEETRRKIGAKAAERHAKKHEAWLLANSSGSDSVH